ncbi:MAG: hypothetical protein MJZ60_03475 [Bacteroidaceae bacterium]|nr:hypothetical protein [Bacteroidaceae bacterium]
MKKNVLWLAAGSVAMLTSCSKLGPLSPDYFTVNPTPLEAISGEVPATVFGNFPAKYMKKKAVVTVTPVLKYEGGEAQGQSATFQGEKVQGNATTIQYKVGGNYSMKSNWAYNDAMLQSDLYLQFDAKLGKKTVTIPEVKIGYGVLATSQLLGRAISSSKASVAPDAFQRVIAQKQEANIKFLIAQANLRTSELESVSIKDLVNILREINDNEETRALSSIEVSAYASPDGRYDYNERLAEKRQDVSTSYLQKELKKIKMDADINTKFTAEDWEGFQQLVSASNLQDKQVILRVLSMYEDPEQREQQIKNMSEIYTGIKEGIMPELRRARLIVNYDVIGRSDEQIVEQFGTDASKLSVEELLYGAGMLVSNVSQKEAWYTKTTQIYPSDYRAFNNLAQIAYEKGDKAAAKQYLQKALSINNNAPQANTNMSLIALGEGKVQDAEMFLAKGSGSDIFNDVMGAVNLAKGNYVQAATNLHDTKSNVAALAQLLNKDYVSARNTLDKIENADATTSYLKAIVGARTNDANLVSAGLRDAFAKDPSLVQRALKDLEFSKFASTVKSLAK